MTRISSHYKVWHFLYMFYTAEASAMATLQEHCAQVTTFIKPEELRTLVITWMKHPIILYTLTYELFEECLRLLSYSGDKCVTHRYGFYLEIKISDMTRTMH